MFTDVVALYGVPRSGTSWLGQILDSCPETVFRFQPLFSYRFKNRITTETTKEEIKNFFEELYLENKDDFLNQTDKRENGIYPLFHMKQENASILAYKEVRYLYTIPLLLQKYREIKIIGIIRNPYDVLESWINAPSEYNPEWNIYEEWNFAASKNEYRPENYFGYNKWKEFIKMCFDMQKRYPQNFEMVRYEDLESDACYVAKKIYAFAKMPFTEQTKEFIRLSQSKTVESSYGVYRKKNQERKRKYYLPSDIRNKIAMDLRDFSEAKKLGY